MDRTIRNHCALSSATAQLTFDDYHPVLRATLHVGDTAPRRSPDLAAPR